MNKKTPTQFERSGRHFLFWMAVRDHFTYLHETSFFVQLVNYLGFGILLLGLGGCLLSLLSMIVSLVSEENLNLFVTVFILAYITFVAFLLAYLTHRKAG